MLLVVRRAAAIGLDADEHDDGPAADDVDRDELERSDITSRDDAIVLLHCCHLHAPRPAV